MKKHNPPPPGGGNKGGGEGGVAGDGKRSRDGLWGHAPAGAPNTQGGAVGGGSNLNGGVKPPNQLAVAGILSESYFRDNLSP